MRKIQYILLGAVLLCPCCRQVPEAVTFGVVADIQYDREEADRMGRHYTLGARRLAEAVDSFLVVPGLSFMIDLGDTTDRDYTQYADLSKEKDRLGRPCYNVFGNHDFRPSVTAGQFAEAAAIKGLWTPYYSFIEGGVRFIFLNSSDIAPHSSPKDSPDGIAAARWWDDLKECGAANAKEYNGAMGLAQMNWLSSELEEADVAGQPVIIACHMLLLPPGSAESLWNSMEVVSILERHPCVKAVFCGHRHSGGYCERNGIHYMNFMGMVEGDSNRFSVVSISPKGKDYSEGGTISIDGFGDEADRVLGF